MIHGSVREISVPMRWDVGYLQKPSSVACPAACPAAHRRASPRPRSGHGACGPRNHRTRNVSARNTSPPPAVLPSVHCLHPPSHGLYHCHAAHAAASRTHCDLVQDGWVGAAGADGVEAVTHHCQALLHALILQRRSTAGGGRARDAMGPGCGFGMGRYTLEKPNYWVLRGRTDWAMQGSNRAQQVATAK